MSRTDDKKDRPAPRKKPPALGRGLAALLGDNGLAPGTQATDPRPGEKVIETPVERLEPNPFQPRRTYETQALKALADSIAEHGLLQPILVRRWARDIRSSPESAAFGPARWPVSPRCRWWSGGPRTSRPFSWPFWRICSGRI